MLYFCPLFFCTECVCIASSFGRGRLFDLRLFTEGDQVGFNLPSE
jgi:hypothetical protein